MIFRLVLTEVAKALFKRVASGDLPRRDGEAAHASVDGSMRAPAEPRGAHKPSTTAASEPPRRIDILIAEYADATRSLINRTLLVIVIPAVAWGIIALLWWLPFPQVLRIIPGLNWASLVVVGVAASYLAFSWKVAGVVFGFGAVGIALARAYELYGQVPLWQMALTALFCATLARLIGARFEGRASNPRQAVRNVFLAPAWLASRFLAMWRIQP